MENKTQKLWFWVGIISILIALAQNILIAPAQEGFSPLAYRITLISTSIILSALYLLNIRRQALLFRGRFILGLACAAVIWDLITAKFSLLPLPFFPSLAQILDVIVEDWSLLALSALYSMRLYFVGMIAGASLGLISGALIGWFKIWDYWLSPIIRFSGIVPAVAWLPIALVIFPSSFATGVFLIFISSWFPVSSMMAQGISSTPKSFFESARTLGASPNYLLFKVAIPNSMPSVFTGILTASAFSFTTLIVSEMVGAKAGLGWYINWAKGWGAYSKVYASIIIIAIEFWLILCIIGAFRAKVLRWQKGILK